MTRARKQRTQFRTSDFDPATGLEVPLNDFALDVQQRLEPLEAVAQRQLVQMSFRTGASVGYRIAPFPLKVGVPFMAKGLILAGIYNQTAQTSALASSPGLDWGPDNRGGIEIRQVWGLSANTQYLLTVEAING